MRACHAGPITAFAFAAVASAAAISPAWADMRVVESNVREIVVGSVLPDDSLPVLPPGGRVRVQYLSTNTFKTFLGPEKEADSRPFGGTRGRPLPK
jgi:hypothetical protein